MVQWSLATVDCIRWWPYMAELSYLRCKVGKVLAWFPFFNMFLARQLRSWTHSTKYGARSKVPLPNNHQTLPKISRLMSLKLWPTTMMVWGVLCPFCCLNSHDSCWNVHICSFFASQSSVKSPTLPQIFKIASKIDTKTIKVMGKKPRSTGVPWICPTFPMASGSSKAQSRSSSAEPRLRPGCAAPWIQGVFERGIHLE